MANVTTRIFMTLALGGALSFSSGSLAQDAGAQGTDANAVTPQSDTATEQPASSPPAKLGQGTLGQGTKAEAEHSAEATAHKSLNDPNNQLGTSLQGRTRPVAGAGNGPPYDTAAVGDPAPAGNAPEKIDQ